MTKANLKAVLKREYEKGSAKYNKLWDALTYLYNAGLVTEAEREFIKEYNHELSKKP